MTYNNLINRYTDTITDMPRSIEQIEQELKEAKALKRKEGLFERYNQNKIELAQALVANDDELIYKKATAFAQRFLRLHPKSDSE